MSILAVRDESCIIRWREGSAFFGDLLGWGRSEINYSLEWGYGGHIFRQLCVCVGGSDFSFS